MKYRLYPFAALFLTAVPVSAAELRDFTGAQTRVVWVQFMMNGDGRFASGGAGTGAGGNTPQGVFSLPNNYFAQRAGGCWPSMSPDNSLRSWVFHYMREEGHRVTADEFERNLAGKMKHAGFLSDTPPLLRPGIEFEATRAYEWVTSNLIPLLK